MRIRPRPNGIFVQLGSWPRSQDETEDDEREVEAARVSEAFLQRWTGEKTIAEAVTELQSEGVISRAIKVSQKFSGLTALPPPPVVPPPPRQRRPCVNSYKYTREVKGGAWQSRVWIDGPGRGISLNLGLSLLIGNDMDSMLTARDSWVRSMAFVKGWVGTKTVGEVVQAMKERGLVKWDLDVPKRAANLRPLANCAPQKSSAKIRDCDRAEI